MFGFRHGAAPPAAGTAVALPPQAFTRGAPLAMGRQNAKGSKKKKKGNGGGKAASNSPKTAPDKIKSPETKPNAVLAADADADSEEKRGSADTETDEPEVAAEESDLDAGFGEPDSEPADLEAAAADDAAAMVGAAADDDTEERRDSPRIEQDEVEAAAAVKDGLEEERGTSEIGPDAQDVAAEESDLDMEFGEPDPETTDVEAAAADDAAAVEAAAADDDTEEQRESPQIEPDEAEAAAVKEALKEERGASAIGPDEQDVATVEAGFDEEQGNSDAEDDDQQVQVAEAEEGREGHEDPGIEASEETAHLDPQDVVLFDGPQETSSVKVTAARGPRDIQKPAAPTDADWDSVNPKVLPKSQIAHQRLAAGTAPKTGPPRLVAEMDDFDLRQAAAGDRKDVGKRWTSSVKLSRPKSSGDPGAGSSYSNAVASRVNQKVAASAAAKKGQSRLVAETPDFDKWQAAAGDTKDVGKRWTSSIKLGTPRSPSDASIAKSGWGTSSPSAAASSQAANRKVAANAAAKKGQPRLAAEMRAFDARQAAAGDTKDVGRKWTSSVKIRLPTAPSDAGGADVASPAAGWDSANPKGVASSHIANKNVANKKTGQPRLVAEMDTFDALKAAVGDTNDVGRKWTSSVKVSTPKSPTAARGRSFDGPAPQDVGETQSASVKISGVQAARKPEIQATRDWDRANPPVVASSQIANQKIADSAASRSAPPHNVAPDTSDVGRKWTSSVQVRTAKAPSANSDFVGPAPQDVGNKFTPSVKVSSAESEAKREAPAEVNWDRADPRVVASSHVANKRIATDSAAKAGPPRPAAEAPRKRTNEPAGDDSADSIDNDDDDEHSFTGP